MNVEIIRHIVALMRDFFLIIFFIVGIITFIIGIGVMGIVGQTAQEVRDSPLLQGKISANLAPSVSGLGSNLDFGGNNGNGSNLPVGMTADDLEVPDVSSNTLSLFQEAFDSFEKRDKAKTLQKLEAVNTSLKAEGKNDSALIVSNMYGLVQEDKWDEAEMQMIPLYATLMS